MPAEKKGHVGASIEQLLSDHKNALLFFLRNLRQKARSIAKQEKSVVKRNDADTMNHLTELSMGH